MVLIDAMRVMGWARESSSERRGARGSQSPSQEAGLRGQGALRSPRSRCGMMTNVLGEGLLLQLHSLKQKSDAVVRKMRPRTRVRDILDHLPLSSLSKPTEGNVRAVTNDRACI